MRKFAEKISSFCKKFFEKKFIEQAPEEDSATEKKYKERLTQIKSFLKINSLKVSKGSVEIVSHFLPISARKRWPRIHNSTKRSTDKPNT